MKSQEQDALLSFNLRNRHCDVPQEALQVVT